MITKNEIRETIKKQREALDPLNKQKLDELIIEKINKKSEFKTSHTILFYISHKNEVDLKNLIVDSLKEKIIVLPKVKEDNLTLHQINSFDDLEKGAYGILEPKQDTKIFNPAEIDLAFIPGVAFDSQGHRIGFGKGYYDKLNKELKCLKIGIAYDFQIVDEIPFEPHDVPVDLLITN